jgi:prepilin peptidase CpaA
LTTLADTSIASPSLGRHRGTAATVGLLLAAPVLVSGWVASMPLPILGWAAAFLFFAVERDVHCQRIPNWLTFPAFAAALLYGAFVGGPEGALDALLGAGAAFALLLLPYGVGALGAGDVKAAMVLGAGFGAAALTEQMLLAIVFGGVFAVLRLARRELSELVSSTASPPPGARRLATSRRPRRRRPAASLRGSDRPGRHRSAVLEIR